MQQAIVSTYEATQAEQAAEVGDLRAALAAVQAENLILQARFSLPHQRFETSSAPRPWHDMPLS